MYCNNKSSINNFISFICRNQYDYFLNKQYVEGVGLGVKEINGISTSQPCIKVFVSKKLCTSNLDRNNMIPSMFNGVPTDVIEMGIATPCGLTRKIRPVPGGFSIGPSVSNTVGTFGCLVQNSAKREHYILSTSHILSQVGKLPIGTAILQPAIPDGGNKDTDIVAYLEKFVPIKYSSIFSKPVNYVDAALAKIPNIALVSPHIAILNKSLKGTDIAQVGDKVSKVGRTTERTSGLIVSIDVTEKVHYPKGTALFKDQIIAKVKTDKGDSGSMLLTEDMRALGMLTSNGTLNNGVNTDYGVFCDITHIISQLQIQLVTNNDIGTYPNNCCCCCCYNHK